MKNTTKKWLIVAGGLVACAALAFIITGQFGKEPVNDVVPPSSSSQQSGVVVDEPDSGSSSEKNEPQITVKPETPNASSAPETSGSGNGAVSSGTEQTIQGDPEKPNYDDKVLKDPTQKPDGTLVDGKPEAEDHDTVEPPRLLPPPTPVAACLGLTMSQTLDQTRWLKAKAMVTSINRLVLWTDKNQKSARKAQLRLCFLICQKGDRMKRIVSMLLVFSMLFSIICVNAYAAEGTGGSGNIDGGGGSMGDATSHGSWNPGNEGVRVTVVRASDHAVVTTPLDLTNKAPAATIYHFGKVSKIQYNNGTGISPVQGGYACVVPPQSIPRVISTNGTNNIEALKKYFCSEFLVQLIANHTGMDYDALIGGEYKLLLEPIAYYKFEGVMIATTATEAALYDEIVGGQLRYWMGSLTAKNLPLSMFLETPDLGYPAWSGATNKNASNADIKSSLGLGIVRFEEQPEEPVITTYDYEYRVNTEVITAVDVSGGQSDPDNPARVTFTIDGRSYNVGNVYYPEGDSQLAWVRWTTPDTPQDMTITVRVSGPGDAQGTINCKIVDLDKNPPPNPVADDRNDSFWCCIIILDTSASRIYKKRREMEVVK